MKPVIIALGAALALSGAHAAAAQPVSPAVAEAGQAEREALVRRYFEVIDFDQMMETMTESLLSTILSQNASITPEYAEIVQASYAEASTTIMPEYMDQVVALYAEILTHEELTSMVAFYESPVGRSITTKTVILTEQTGQLFQTLSERLLPVFVERLCARVDCPSN